MVMMPLRSVEKRLRPSRALLVAIAALGPAAIASCASRVPNDLAHPGWSDAPVVGTQRAAAAAVGSAETWDQAAALPTFERIDDRKLPSRGHNPPFWSGDVSANAVLAPTYRVLGPDSVIPEGAVVAEAHHGSDASDGPTFAMVKRASGFDEQGGNWEYLIVRTDGHVDSRGVLPLCSRCHSDAPYDHLFGPRVSSRRRILGEVDGGVAETDASLPSGEDDEGRSPDEGTLPNGTKPPTKPTKKRHSH